MSLIVVLMCLCLVDEGEGFVGDLFKFKSWEHTFVNQFAGLVNQHVVTFGQLHTAFTQEAHITGLLATLCKFLRLFGCRIGEMQHAFQGLAGRKGVFQRQVALVENLPLHGGIGLAADTVEQSTLHRVFNVLIAVEDDFACFVFNEDNGEALVAILLATDHIEHGDAVTVQALARPRPVVEERQVGLAAPLVVVVAVAADSDLLAVDEQGALHLAFRGDAEPPKAK